MIDQLSTFLGSDISHALGWTIIHSLWQVSLLALTMSVIHRIYKDRSAELRYNVSLGTMAISLFVSAVTFLLYYTNNNVAIADGGVISISDKIGLIEVATEDSILGMINAFVIDNIEHINVIWTTGLILFLLRFIISLGYVQYIRNTSIPLVDKYVSAKIDQLRNSLLIKKYTSVAESAKISVPMVLGHIKPIILFPIGMINMLSTSEIEAIIIHELTHIKRNDYAVNIAITLIETLYYYHPAMWWVSANVKAERENCCDDAAISHNIDSVTYAKALVKLEEIRKTGIPALAMPFASNKHQLLNRVKRILNMEQTKNDIKEKSIATVLLLSVAMIFASNTMTPQSEIVENREEIEVAKLSDTSKLLGNDEIILEVNKGLFSSLTVDGIEVKEGEIVEQLKKTFSNENADVSNNDQDQKFLMKGNPMLTLVDQSVMFHGDESSLTTGLNITGASLVDTLPKKMHLDQDRIKISTNKNNKKIEVERENGKIVGLKIDGKVIPKSEFDQHQELIDDALEDLVFDFDGQGFENMRFDWNGGDMDSIFSKSFGMIFDGENMRRFEGDMSEMLEGLEGLEGLKSLENLKSLKGLEGLKGLRELEGLHELQNLRGLEGLHELHNLENLGEYLDQMGIQLDSSMKIYNFDGFEGFDGFDRFDSFDGFDGFDFFNDDNMEIRSFGGNESGTVVDKLGSALNKDGLLEAYKSNKIELSGKHLKINGDKMPKALFNKYKDIYQQETGAALTKKSKMIFDVEGKPSKRRIQSF